MSGRYRTRRTGLGIGVLVAIGLAILQFPTRLPGVSSITAGGGTASARPVDALSAPAQSALDRVLGPGHSIVTASAVYGAGSSRTSTSYDARHVAVLQQSSVNGPGYRAVTTNNGVSSSITSSTTPGGQVQKLSVAVVVDSRIRPVPRPVTIRQVVSAAMGLQANRGDKITVAVAPMPTAVTAALPQTSVVRLVGPTFGPYLPSALWTLAALGLGGLLAVTRRKARTTRSAAGQGST